MRRGSETIQSGRNAARRDGTTRTCSLIFADLAINPTSFRILSTATKGDSEDLLELRELFEVDAARAAFAISSKALLAASLAFSRASPVLSIAIGDRVLTAWRTAWPSLLSVLDMTIGIRVRVAKDNW